MWNTKLQCFTLCNLTDKSKQLLVSDDKEAPGHWESFAHEQWMYNVQCTVVDIVNFVYKETLNMHLEQHWLGDRHLIYYQFAHNCHCVKFHLTSFMNKKVKLSKNMQIYMRMNIKNDKVNISLGFLQWNQKYFLLGTSWYTSNGKMKSPTLYP